MKTASRPYRQVERARAATDVTERILDAAVALFWASPGEVVLTDVARAAGVSVPTVLRRFGSKDALLLAAAARERDRIARQRGSAAPGDVPAAVAVLVTHYEQVGDGVLRALAEEARVPGLRETVTDPGREMHRQWCARVFAPALERRRGAEHDRLLAQVVAICDVHMWRLLRRDAGLSRRQTEQALVEMLDPLLE